MKKKQSVFTTAAMYVFIITVPVILLKLLLDFVGVMWLPDLKCLLTLIQEAIGFSYIVAIVDSLDFFGDKE